MMCLFTHELESTHSMWFKLYCQCSRSQTLM